MPAVTHAIWIIIACGYVAFSSGACGRIGYGPVDGEKSDVPKDLLEAGGEGLITGDNLRLDWVTSHSARLSWDREGNEPDFAAARIMVAPNELSLSSRDASPT